MNTFTHGPIMNRLDQFTRAYLECALWSSVSDPAEGENNGEPLDANYSIFDLAPEAVEQAKRECKAFLETNRADIESGCSRTTPDHDSGCKNLDESQAGHDFWLTRNGHGAGFWDGDWPEPAASRLTEASKRAGQRDLHVGDDGKLYFFGG